MIKWLYITGYDTAVPFLPKCASTSLEAAMEGKQVDIVTPAEALNVKHRPAWIREPVDRLVSCFSHFTYLRQNSTTQTVIPDDALESWEDFIDWHFNSDDPHVYPMVKLLTYDGQFVPTAVYKVEDIVKTFGQYAPGLLPWYRACTHIGVDTNYRIDDIRDYHKESFGLWQSL